MYITNKQNLSGVVLSQDCAVGAVVCGDQLLFGQGGGRGHLQLTGVVLYQDCTVGAVV